MTEAGAGGHSSAASGDSGRLVAMQ